MGIYLDHNAGSPLRPEARAAIARLIGEQGGNPASVHRPGQSARRALEMAREQVAHLLNADSRQIVFTSGGTESNNLAILGAALSAGGGRKRIVATAIEHSSVMAPLAELEGRGFEVIRISPDRDGCVDPEVLAAAIRDDVALVTLGLVNAEVGAIQEVAAIARATSRAGALFHLDAAQAVGRIPVRVEDLGCD